MEEHVSVGNQFKHVYMPHFGLSGSFCCGVQNFNSFHRIFGVRGLVKKQTVLITVCSLVFGGIGLGKQFRPRSDEKRSALIRVFTVCQYHSACILLAYFCLVNHSLNF